MATEVGHFVRMVFSDLNNEGVRYVVLRNYDGLPNNEGHDIDVLVEQNALTSFESVLLCTAREQQWSLVRNPRRHGFSSYFFARWSNHSGIRIIKWDIWEPILWKGLPWIDTCEVIDGAGLNNSFYIPSPGAEAASLLLKELFQLGTIRKKYYERIKTFCQKDPDGFNSALVGHLGENSVRRLYKQVQDSQWEKIKISYQRLRLTLIARALRFKPGATFLGLLRFGLSHFRQYLTNQNGLFLCFIGPDGSGKSTISHEVANSLSEVFEDVRYYHGHFGILPELKAYIRWWPRKKMKQEKTSSIAKNIAPMPTRSLLYFLYYSLDYMLGHLPIVLARGRGNLIIFDRYFYDYVIQPGPLSVENNLFHTFLSIIPTPDVVIYPIAPPDVIRARKPELPIKEIARQSDVCMHLVTNLPNAFVVDNTPDLDQVVARICEMTLEQMTEIPATLS